MFCCRCRNNRSIFKRTGDVGNGFLEASLAGGNEALIKQYENAQKELERLKTEEGKIKAEIKRLEKEMREAAARLDFEVAAVLRDKIQSLKGK